MSVLQAIRRRLMWKVQSYRAKHIMRKLDRYEAPPHIKHARFSKPVIVSLTSYPPRFKYLAYTLKSILLQNVRANQVILWIADDDLSTLPESVKDLEQHGLSIRGCADTRSYKKLLPALEQLGSCYIVTADDDVYYEPEWLGSLLREVPLAPSEIIAHRAHLAKFDETGVAVPYADWDHNTTVSKAPDFRSAIFPTGIGGVLYPPNSLALIASNVEMIRELCPDADDVWFFWMAALAGVKARKSSYDFIKTTWPGSQLSGLHVSNTQQGGNDRQIGAVQSKFGNYENCLNRSTTHQ